MNLLPQLPRVLGVLPTGREGHCWNVRVQKRIWPDHRRKGQPALGTTRGMRCLRAFSAFLPVYFLLFFLGHFFAFSFAPSALYPSRGWGKGVRCEAPSAPPTPPAGPCPRVLGPLQSRPLHPGGGGLGSGTGGEMSGLNDCALEPWRLPQSCTARCSRSVQSQRWAALSRHSKGPRPGARPEPAPRPRQRASSSSCVPLTASLCSSPNPGGAGLSLSPHPLAFPTTSPLAF